LRLLKRFGLVAFATGLLPLVEAGDDFHPAVFENKTVFYHG
jgi:hypothetical protein